MLDPYATIYETIVVLNRSFRPFGMFFTDCKLRLAFFCGVFLSLFFFYPKNTLIDVRDIAYYRSNLRGFMSYHVFMKTFSFLFLFFPPF